MKTGIIFIFLIALLSLLGCSGDSNDGQTPAVQEKSVPWYVGTKSMGMHL
jgi:hypothetical protein|tara:strand:+ start:2834 stop:2983 length:150 start_codon:yes stop_codon:yes gene_type:complete